MQATTFTNTILEKERQTRSAVSFKVVDMPTTPTNVTGQPSPSMGDSHAPEPEIKKRLEAYSHQQLGSEEAIAEKLKRAEAKRKQALLNRGGNVSPRQAEERRRAAK